VSLLRGSVSAGESGPLITLSGETDLTTVAELSELVTGQLAGGTRHLTIDASGLSFADSASVRVLLLAARTLREHGGCLVLLRPQGALARVLEIMGADQMITVRGEIERAPAPEATAGLSPESGVHGLRPSVCDQTRTRRRFGPGGSQPWPQCTYHLQGCEFIRPERRAPSSRRV
jgi:anti-anti-sigma factor